MNRDRFAFIIRIWHEAESEDSPIRGSIQLVSSDNKLYFSSLDDVPHLMRSFDQFGETIQDTNKTIHTLEGNNLNHGDKPDETI